MDNKNTKARGDGESCETIGERGGDNLSRDQKNLPFCNSGAIEGSDGRYSML